MGGSAEISDVLLGPQPCPCPGAVCQGCKFGAFSMVFILGDGTFSLWTILVK